MSEYYISILCLSVTVVAYSNSLFRISKLSVDNADICERYENLTKPNQLFTRLGIKESKRLQLTSNTSVEEMEDDLFEIHQDLLYRYIFGDNVNQIDHGKKQPENTENDTIDILLHSPTGQALRKAELFQNKMMVHLPRPELINVGYCVLNITDDYMQTAVDAFAIFVHGDLDDVRGLPADYILRSTRTIAMLKISKEKLAATWEVVKEGHDPFTVTYGTLERYRPLFKYLNGKEIARLNLADNRILNFIGTHPDLNRHQVGVVASKYIKLNSHWSEPKYLNLMNNLICGIPMSFMRKIPDNTFLQLSHQIFYHTRACDPLQRRFYLVMMTKTQALGKTYSWNAQDVSRLGLLLSEVEGRELGSIKPEALAGLTAQVIAVMQPKNLEYLTKAQIRYISGRPLNILAKKLKEYQDQISFSSYTQSRPHSIFSIIIVICMKLSYYW